MDSCKSMLQVIGCHEDPCEDRGSRSSVSTLDTETETWEAPEIPREGPFLSLAMLREPSPEALDAARALAVTEASKALEAAGITMERLDHGTPRLYFLILFAIIDELVVLARTAEVCSMMDKEGFHGKYDFLYLPIDDFRSKASLGYAFVNLINAEEALLLLVSVVFFEALQLFHAVCSVSWSGPHQGQQSHIQRYRPDSPVMHSSVQDEFKPVIFEAGLLACSWLAGACMSCTGKRLDFPPPSKKLRAPRRRPTTLS
eukprot:Skav204246  [mRNA]  locus=scaffold2414:12233:17947:- [translate_table: standard]